MSRRTRWIATALILLAAAAVQAAPQAVLRPGRAGAPRPASLFDAARKWLSCLFTPGAPEAGEPRRPGEKEGGMMDPNGEPPHGSTGGATDPDPNG